VDSLAAKAWTIRLATEAASFRFLGHGRRPFGLYKLKGLNSRGFTTQWMTSTLQLFGLSYVPSPGDTISDTAKGLSGCRIL
jgi:hypothetical protein